MPYITFKFEKELISEEEGYETEEFEYEYDYDILKEEIIKEFANEYNLSLEKAKEIVEDLNLYEILEERYECELEENIQDRLYKKAYDSYKDQMDLDY